MFDVVYCPECHSNYKWNSGVCLLIEDSNADIVYSVRRGNRAFCKCGNVILGSFGYSIKNMDLIKSMLQEIPRNCIYNLE